MEQVTLTASVPALPLSYYRKALRAARRARHASHRKRNRNRGRRHWRDCQKNYELFRQRVAIIPASAFVADTPPHAEPSYG